MEEGIRSSIERTPKTNDPYGCGYSLKVQGDTDRAVRLLKEAGIRVLGTYEANGL